MRRTALARQATALHPGVQRQTQPAPILHDGIPVPRRDVRRKKTRGVRAGVRSYYATKIMMMENGCSQLLGAKLCSFSKKSKESEGDVSWVFMMPAGIELQVYNNDDDAAPLGRVGSGLDLDNRR